MNKFGFCIFLMHATVSIFFTNKNDFNVLVKAFVTLFKICTQCFLVVFINNV